MGLEAIGLKAILDDGNFQAGLKRYQQGVSQMEKSTDHAAGILSRLGGIASGALVVGIGAATAAFGGAIAIAKSGLDATMAWAEQLDKLGDQFGLSGEKASGWAFLMNKVGLSVDEGAMGLNFFTRGLDDFATALAKGDKTVSPFGKALQQLGVSATDAKGKVKTFDQIMPEIMDRFQKLPAGVNASALAMDLFGARGGSKFLDFLRQGSIGLKDATAQAEDFGLELSTDAVDRAEQFGFELNKLNLGFLGFRNTIGRYVLPIAKQLVSWISSNLIPRLVDLARRYMPLLISWTSKLADWVGTYLMPRLRQFTDWIASTAIPFVQRLVGAFQSGGLLGVIRQLADEVRAVWPMIQEAFKSWGIQFWNWITTDALPRAGAELGKILTAIRTWVEQNGPALAAAFNSWVSDFWLWLWGPGGALERTKVQLEKVMYRILDWVSDPANTQPIWAAMLGWVSQFWQWLTDPSSGVLVTVSENMAQLYNNIREWSEQENTKKQFREIGRTVARTIIDGIGSLFSERSEGENLIAALIRNLWNAYRSGMGALLNIGRSISEGIMSGVLSIFTDPSTADRLAQAITTMEQNAVNLVIGQLQSILQPLFDAIQRLVSIFWQNNPPTAPSGVGPPPERPPLGYQRGGYVPYDLVARLHRGEYVIPAGQAAGNVVNNSRMIGPGAIVINFPSTGGLSESRIRDTVYSAVSEVLNSA